MIINKSFDCVLNLPIRFSEHQTVAYSMALLLIHDNKQIIRLNCVPRRNPRHRILVCFSNKIFVLKSYNHFVKFLSSEAELRVNLRLAAAGWLSLSLFGRERLHAMHCPCGRRCQP